MEKSYEELKNERGNIGQTIIQSTEIPDNVEYHYKPYELKKHYLGDIKWVLYQYICDTNENCVLFCGNFAFNKLINLGDIQTKPDIPDKYKYLDKYFPFDTYAILNLNGEKVELLKRPSMDKKKVEIHTIEKGNVTELYFA